LLLLASIEKSLIHEMAYDNGGESIWLLSI